MAPETIPPRMREVTFESADYSIDFSVKDSSDNIYYYSLLVELSDFGKRIRKVLQGCGYQIDFGSKTEVSLMPLFAQFKAYFGLRAKIYLITATLKNFSNTLAKI